MKIEKNINSWLTHNSTTNRDTSYATFAGATLQRYFQLVSNFRSLVVTPLPQDTSDGIIETFNYTSCADHHSFWGFLSPFDFLKLGCDSTPNILAS